MNLIGSRPDRWWNDPDRAVRRLIGELDRYAAATGEVVTVVFDRQPHGVPPGAHGAAVIAFASRRGRDAADHEIIRMLAEDPSPDSFRVVTSDRRLVERARQLGAEVTSSMSFRRRIDQTLAGAHRGYVNPSSACGLATTLASQSLASDRTGLHRVDDAPDLTSGDAPG
jgi:predicted RNA-binding protein with PIN domain